MSWKKHNIALYKFDYHMFVESSFLQRGATRCNVTGITIPLQCDTI